MKRALCSLVAALVVGTSASTRADDTTISRAGAEEATQADWTGRSARVAPRLHGQAALLAESRLGLGRNLQLGAHLLGLVAPHASLLYRAFAQGGVHVSPRLGLAYPAPFYQLFTGKGAFALLPADSKPPQVLLIEPGVRASLELPRGQLVTVEAALTLRARFRHGSSPLLDFPFFFPRFAAIHTPVTARFAGTVEGAVVSSLRYVASLDVWILPVVHHGFALEPRVGAAWAFRRRVTLELGERMSYARYPVGVRFHATPYADVRVRF